MARQTIVVVAGIVARQILMRIVAGGATDPLVISQKTFAVRQPVGLKSHIQLAPGFHADHGIPGAMATPAEVGHILRRKLAQFLGRRTGLAFRQRLLMRAGAGVAMLAIETGLHGVERQSSLLTPPELWHPKQLTISSMDVSRPIASTRVWGRSRSLPMVTASPPAFG